MIESVGIDPLRSQRVAGEALVGIFAPGRSRCEPKLDEYSATTAGRERIEDFIRAEYAKHFDATVNEFMPSLLAVPGRNGEVRAAAGYRAAGDGALFLEQYTRGPIEDMIAAKLGARAPRKQIVEVGGLACRGRLAAIDMIRALVPHLIVSGFAWIVFTGADTLADLLRLMSLEPHKLCRAERTLLGTTVSDWGSYYEHNPIVMGGRLLDGIEQLELMPDLCG